MTSFEFATPARILVGAGASRETGVIARSLGRHALIVTGRDTSRAAPVEASLKKQGVGRTLFATPGEPTVDSVEQGVRVAREGGCDLVIAFGGGSALDAAKAIAALAPQRSSVLDHLEVIGCGQPLRPPTLPLIAIPTTAGTGAEVTRNAVLASPAHRMKASLRSPLLLARVAIVDPQLARDLPPDLTASTGMDALTQLIEPYVSHRANPLTDGLCVEGIRRASRSLRRAFEHGGDMDAREDMAVASLFSGFALANAGLGAVHGFAAAIGGMFTVPHGCVCAALLPHVMAANLRALLAREPRSDALRRHEEIARLVTGRPQATADDGVAWVRELCAALAIRPLSAWKLSAADVPEVVEKAMQSSSMKANPLPLTAGELRDVLLAAI